MMAPLSTPEGLDSEIDKKIEQVLENLKMACETKSFENIEDMLEKAKDSILSSIERSKLF
jgi:HPt (histidine-containing phosphotransfer) domain-containing protein